VNEGNSVGREAIFTPPTEGGGCFQESNIFSIRMYPCPPVAENNILCVCVLRARPPANSSDLNCVRHEPRQNYTMLEEERRFMSTEKTPAPLDRLGFAAAEHPWDEQAAAKRVLESFGWAGLAAYSLAMDVSADAESAEAYKLLVVDVVDGEPLIIPAALSSARESLGELEGNVRETAEQTLAFLGVKLARTSESTGKQESTAVPEEGAQEETSENRDASKPDAGRLAQAERIVDNLAAKGSLLPAWGRETLTGFIAGLSTEPTLTVDGFERVSPLEFFTGLVESLPAFIPTQEFAPPQAPQDRSLESLGRRIAASFNKVNS